MSNDRPSRGESPSAYYPGFQTPSGIKASVNDLKADVITGSIVSANVTYAVPHNLGKVPSLVLVSPRLTLAVATSTGINVAEATASAATSANIYLAGNKAGAGYGALVIA